ncbi:hypothetical protein A1351_12335 [Methylosinus sp. R-45379]|nr:hypothetical protein A1351_12335 [Methylosinus sp. R-45379]
MTVTTTIMITATTTTATGMTIAATGMAMAPIADTAYPSPGARRTSSKMGRREQRPIVDAAENRHSCVGSDFLELIGRGFAGAAVLGEFVAHLLAFAQIAQTGALDGANMNENIRAAFIGLDEAEALLTIEPFHRSGSHFVSPGMYREKARMRGAGSIDVWKRSSAASFPKQVQVVMPKIDGCEK